MLNRVWKKVWTLLPLLLTLWSLAPMPARAALVRGNFSDVVSQGPTLQVRSFFDGQSGRPTLAEWEAEPLTVNVTSAIRAAATAAVSSGKTLRFTPGIYSVTPDLVFDDEDESYLTYVVCLMESNLHVEGDPGSSIRIADNVSTEGAPRSMAVFATNGVLSHVSFRGLTFDLNGQNNQISPSRPSSYNRYNQSAILVSGTPGGVAAAMSDVVIENCIFKNNAGVSTVCMAQSATPGVTLGKGWLLRNNQFLNSGTDTDDHSAVFGWADDVRLENNTFANDAPYGTVGRTGGNTGYEVHGSNHVLTGNTFRNFVRGTWVGSNFSTPVTGTIIDKNRFETLFYGVDFFRDSSSLSAIYDTVINNNIFSFDDTSVALIPGLNLKTGINVASDYAQQGISAKGNRFRKTGASVAAIALAVSPGNVAGQTHDNIVFEGNEGVGLTYGTFIRTNATNGLGEIAARYNHWRDMTPAGIYSSAAAGDAVLYTSSPNTIKSLSLGGGSVVDLRTTPLCTHGITLTGAIGALSLLPSSFSGMVSAGYSESALSVTKRSGYFDNIAFTPTFKSSGGAITLGASTREGYYSLAGDRLTVNARISFSGATIPSGSLQLDLPFPSSLSGIQWLGNGRIWDSSASQFYPLLAEIDGTGTVAVFQQAGAVANVTEVSPITWADGDILSVQIVYGL